MQCPACDATIADGSKTCQKCGAKTEVRIVQKPTVVTKDFIAEEVWDRVGLPKYLLYHFSEDRFEEVSKIDLGETDAKGRKIVYVPVDNEMLHKGLVIVPTGVTNTSFTEVLERADRFSGLPNYDACGQDPVIRFLVRVVVCSWFLDRFVEDPMYDVAGAGKFAPIIPIRGPSQSGKNRFAFILRLLSYRPYFEMSTYRVPSLYRPLDIWQGTLVLDEADFAQTSEKSELIHFLNCRATGTPISRQDPQNPKRTHTFTNFGDTILTQRRIFDDNATESRCLPYYSEVTERKLPTLETDQMLKEGLEIQNMLLYLRMKYYRQIKIDKTIWLNGASDPRLMASILPLLPLSEYEPAIKDELVRVIQDIERLKVEQKASSEDGVLVNYLWEKISEGLFALWNNPHYYVLTKEKKEDEEVNVPLTSSRVADELKWTTRNIRKVLNSLNIVAPGLPAFVKVGNKSWRVIFFDPSKLERRLREFVVTYTPQQLSILVNDRYVQRTLNDTQKKVTEVTEVTDNMYGETSSQDQRDKGEKDTPYIKSVTCVTSVTTAQEPGRDLSTLRKSIEEGLSGKRIDEEFSTESEEVPETCWICRQPLPENLANTTYERGRLVHKECADNLFREREAARG